MPPRPLCPQDVVSPAQAGIDLRAHRRTPARKCLPRPRGDRPAPSFAPPLRRGSPPPTRGSTAEGDPIGGPLVVSPAHAGIDPVSIGYSTRRGRLPRPRGDRPGADGAEPAGRPSPPPTRGSTTDPVGARGRDGVSPAHAGIDLARAVGPHQSSRLPRPRGDRPTKTRPPQAHTASPPPTRGSTGHPPYRHHRCEVSPAHAGIDPKGTPRGFRPSCLPRPRGDRPRLRVEQGLEPMSPPPTRGSTGSPVVSAAMADVSPAHAGIDPARG